MPDWNSGTPGDGSQYGAHQSSHPRLEGTADGVAALLRGKELFDRWTLLTKRSQGRVSDSRVAFLAAGKIYATVTMPRPRELPREQIGLFCRNMRQ